MIGSGIISALVLTYLGGLVNGARKKYGVPLPALYADQSVADKNENARIFNCVQRGACSLSSVGFIRSSMVPYICEGHQNALESYPYVLMFLFVGGLRHPAASAAAAFVWSLGRIFYAHGYATGDPKNRSRVRPIS